MSYYSQGGGYGGGNGYSQPPAGGGFGNASGQQPGFSAGGNNDPNAWQHQQQQQPQYHQQPTQQQPQPNPYANPPAPPNPYGFSNPPVPSSQPAAPGFDSFLQTQTVAATTQFLASTLSNPGSQDAVLKMGATFLDQSTARMIPGLELVMTSLRRYFAVDHGYVRAKMQRVSFPFFVQQWQRQVRTPTIVY